MPGLLQGCHQGWVKTILQLQGRGDITPGSPQQPARGSDRLLQGLTEAGVAGEYRCLCLGLSLPAHGPIRHDPAIVKDRQGGVEGMERLHTRLQTIQGLGVEREAGASVLPTHPAVAQHRARAEFPVHTLNEADRTAARVHRPHPDGVARLSRIGPRQGLVGVDLARQLRERLGGQEILRRGRQTARVGDHAFTHTECTLGGFHQPVHMRKAFALAHAQLLKQPEDHQRGQTLRRRR